MQGRQQEQQVEHKLVEDVDVVLQPQQTSIFVHAKLPTNPESSPSASTDIWKWTLILDFPIHKLRALQLSKRPYKWLRYATGIVLGAQGHLHEGEDTTSNLVTYEADTLSDETTNLYYHLPEDGTESMLPFDPYFPNAGKTSTTLTMGRTNFRDDVRHRDGKKCVITGLRDYLCDAAHLVPLGKGSSYIETLTRGRRREQDNEDEIIQDINDVRNGVFVHKNGHAALGRDIAILKTPNFAMCTWDVTFVDQGITVQEEVAQGDAAGQVTRYTGHLFDISVPGTPTPLIVPSGSVVQVPKGNVDWPPDVLFDVVYAAAVVHHFGVSVELAVARWLKTYYPDGPMSNGQVEEQRRLARETMHKGRKEKEDSDRTHRAYSRAGNKASESNYGGVDSFDVLHFLPFIRMRPEAKREYDIRLQEEAMAKEHKVLGEKVNSWRDQVPTSVH